MLLHLLRAAPPSAARLARSDFLAAPEAERVGRRRRAACARRWSTTAASSSRARTATGSRPRPSDAFERAFADVPRSPHVEFIHALVPYMLERTA